MHIDFKITNWERIHIPKGYETKVKELMKKGYITCGDDLYDWFRDNAKSTDYMQLFCQDLDCKTQMTPEENGGESTVEVEEDGNIILTNEIKDK